MSEPVTPAEPRKPIWGNLKSRFFTALVFSAVCIPPFYFGGVFWAVLVAIIGARMIWEWVRMSDQGSGAFRYAFPIVGLWSSIVVYFLFPSHVMWWIAIMAILIFFERTRRRFPMRASLGFLYVSIPCLFIIFLRGGDAGPSAPGFSLLLSAILVVVAADTMAYFGGSFFKGPKLAPKISPKKTWSGFISGLLGGMIVGGLCMLWFDAPFVVGFFWAIPTVILSVLGDFLESGLKRHLAVKDAGGLLPGHGGVLDRLDSLMLVAVALGITLWHFPNAWPL